MPRSRAYEVIAGYLVVNDVTVRDWQLRTPTMTMGKSFDTHGPLGPWLTTGDDLGDPHGLRLRTWVNGELRQDSSTQQLIFDCFALVEHLSTAFTLEPGDVKLNKNHFVPTLAHDGLVSIESSLIDEYLEEAFPDVALAPAQPAQRHAQ